MKFDGLKRRLPSIVTVVVLGSAIAYGFLQITTLTVRVESIATELTATTRIISRNTAQISQDLADLRGETLGLSHSLSSTQEVIDTVQTQVGGVQESIGSISGAVGTLEKLVRTDEELLKKYSKVYFLNENYSPAHLTLIPADYIYSTTRPEQFMTEAWPFLKRLLDAATADGKTLFIKSAYRSFLEQQSLKSAYTVIYGAGTANAFSADQGYSEHQLGTTVDFITTGLGGKLAGFENTDDYEWLLANAHRYGFHLSYPKHNAYYIYEPWHWRFVGVKLATYLRDNNKNFYDMDQRDIDTYLATLFD